MYQSGDRVIYGMHGVCTVVDLEKRVVDKKQVIYLVLEPVGQTGSKYMVPTHNTAAMNKVRVMLEREQLEQLLQSQAVHTDTWIQDESQRKHYYRELITSCDRQRLLQMVYSLYCYRTRQSAAGKKLHLCDENFLRDAEKLLCSEISITLNMAPADAKQYLRKMLKEDA